MTPSSVLHDRAVALPTACEFTPPHPAGFEASADLPGDAVCGIVLAGTPPWGAGDFERLLRGPMLPVAQTPIVRYPLEWLRAGGVRSAVICANDAMHRVRAHLGDGSAVGLALDYVEDREPRGPAGCAHDAARRSRASTFIVVDAATIPSLDIAALLHTHRAARAEATIVVEIERRRRPFTDEMSPSPSGVYVFERRVLEAVPGRGYQDIKQGVLERLYAARRHVAIHEVQGITPRVLDHSMYASVNSWQIAQALERPVFLQGYVRAGDALIDPSATLHADARVVGPVVIGAGARVGAGAILVGPSTIGAGSSIGEGAVVSRSFVWERCSVGDRAVITDCLLAQGSTVAGGVHLSDAVELGSLGSTDDPLMPFRRLRGDRPRAGLAARLRAATSASFALRAGSVSATRAPVAPV